MKTLQRKAEFHTLDCCKIENYDTISKRFVPHCVSGNRPTRKCITYLSYALANGTYRYVQCTCVRVTVSDIDLNQSIIVGSFRNTNHWIVGFVLDPSAMQLRMSVPSGNSGRLGICAVNWTKTTIFFLFWKKTIIILNKPKMFLKFPPFSFFEIFKGRKVVQFLC